MVRSSWKFALVLLAAWSGLAAAQHMLSRSRSSGGEQYMMVEEQGKPKQKCRFLGCWTMKDGQKACHVQAVDTGEIITIVGTSGSRGDDQTIYRWGNSKTVPPGFPAPPAHILAKQQTAPRAQPRSTWNGRPNRSGLRTPTHEPPLPSSNVAATKSTHKSFYAGSTGSYRPMPVGTAVTAPTQNYSPYNPNPYSPSKQPTVIAGQSANANSPGTNQYYRSSKYGSSSPYMPSPPAASLTAMPTQVGSYGTTTSRVVSTAPCKQCAGPCSNCGAPCADCSFPSSPYACAIPQGRQRWFSRLGSRQVAQPCGTSQGMNQIHAQPKTRLLGRLFRSPNSNRATGQYHQAPVVVQASPGGSMGASSPYLHPSNCDSCAPGVQVVQDGSTPYVKPLPKLAQKPWPRAHEVGPANGSSNKVLAEIAGTTAAQNSARASQKPIIVETPAIEMPANQWDEPVHQQMQPLPTYTETVEVSPPQVVNPPRPPRRRLWKLLPRYARNKRSKSQPTILTQSNINKQSNPLPPELPRSRTEIGTKTDPMLNPGVDSSKFKIVEAPPAPPTKNKSPDGSEWPMNRRAKKYQRQTSTVAAKKMWNRNANSTNSKASNYQVSRNTTNATDDSETLSAKASANGLPPGAQSVLAAQNGLRIPMKYLPVPVVTVPRPNVPPGPPPPNVPQPPQPNMFATNAFMPPGGNTPRQYNPMMPGTNPQQVAMNYGYRGMPMNPQMAYMMQQRMGYPMQYPGQQMMAQRMGTPSFPVNVPRQYLGPRAPNPIANPMVQHAGYMNPGYYGYPMPMQYNHQTIYRSAMPLPESNAHQNGAEKQMLRTLKTALIPSHREWAILHLAEYDWKRAPHVVQGLLVAAKEDPAASVRAASIHALARMKVDPSIISPTLVALKADAESEVRDAAERALVQLGIEKNSSEKVAMPATTQPKDNVVPASRQATNGTDQPSNGSPTAEMAPTPAALPAAPEANLPLPPSSGSTRTNPAQSPVQNGVIPPPSNDMLPPLPPAR